jgi:hypothetical protein
VRLQGTSWKSKHNRRRTREGGRWRLAHLGRSDRGWSSTQRCGRWLKLEGVATPSMEDGGVVHRLGRRWSWMVVALDGKLSGWQRSTEQSRGG